MKKAKRFLTGLLSAALALSLCAMPAMAEGTGETTPTTPLASAIDKDARVPSRFISMNIMVTRIKPAQV